MIGKDLMGRLEGGVIQAGRFRDGREDPRAARMDGPGSDFRQVQSMVGQPRFQPRSQVLANQVGDPRGEGHLEPLVADPPGHRVLGIVDHDGT